MQVDVSLQLLVDAVYLYVVDKGGYLALLQRLPEERKRLLQQLHVAVVYHLLQALQLLVAGAQRGFGVVLRLLHLQLGTLTALACRLHVAHAGAYVMRANSTRSSAMACLSAAATMYIVAPERTESKAMAQHTAETKSVLPFFLGIKINASFINRNSEKEYNLTYTTLDQYIKGDYQTIVLYYADEVPGPYLPHDITVPYKFAFERKDLENGKYRVSIFLDNDSYRDNSPQAHIFFELENFE